MKRQRAKDDRRQHLSTRSPEQRQQQKQTRSPANRVASSTSSRHHRADTGPKPGHHEYSNHHDCPTPRELWVIRNKSHPHSTDAAKGETEQQPVDQKGHHGVRRSSTTTPFVTLCSTLGSIANTSCQVPA